MYIDPSGEYFGVDDLLAAAIGGTINLVSNVIQGNVHNIGQGFAYFGVGAAGGLTSLYAGPWAGAALIAGGNSILTQGFANGFNNISWFDVGTSSIMGGITGYVRGQLGNYLQKPLTSLYGNISSPVLREMLTQGSVGIGTGFTLNTAMAKINGASWGDAFSSGVDGATWGFATGAANGAAQGYRYAEKNRISPWSGKDDITIQAEKLAKNMNFRTGQKGGAHASELTEEYLIKMYKNQDIFDKGKAYIYDYDGKLTFSDGNHKMAAALKYQVIKGDSRYVDLILKTATYDYRNPKGNVSYKSSTFKISFKWSK